MRILGIDPGMRLSGYGCVEVSGPRAETALVEAGVLRFKASDSMEARLEQLYASIADLIQQFKPQHVAVEKLYAHYKHPRTAIIMGHARGVILLAAEQAGLPIEHLPATEVKKSMCGNGHASKLQIQRAVAAFYQLPEPPSPPDVADAIAIATTAARRIA